MNGLPEYKPDDDPLSAQDRGSETSSHASRPKAIEDWMPGADRVEPPIVEQPPAIEQQTAVEQQTAYEQQPAIEQPMFQRWYEPPPRPPVRIPHLGHVAILMVFVGFGLIGASVFIQAGLHFHLFGVRRLQDAITDIHYTLGSEAILYVFMFGPCLLFFPMIWHKSFFAGIQWNGSTALRLRRQLFITASICFVLALVNGLLMPGPKNAPIDKIFRSPGAAWLLFGFGVTFAPFFEEMIFRGFLLPSLCTAFDWMAQKFTGRPLPTIANRPSWSPRAIVWATAIFASAPAAVAFAYFCLHGRTARSIFFFAYVIGLVLLLTLIEIYGAKSSRADLIFVDHDHPVWSFPALIVGSLATSLPFAAMHAAQTGYSLGPFILLICVSMVLCWARLSTRSLAASVFVHASYNFLLFSLMVLGTSGFRHMDKM